jgi:hypothetical protein
MGSFGSWNIILCASTGQYSGKLSSLCGNLCYILTPILEIWMPHSWNLHLYGHQIIANRLHGRCWTPCGHGRCELECFISTWGSTNCLSFLFHYMSITYSLPVFIFILWKFTKRYQKYFSLSLPFSFSCSFWISFLENSVGAAIRR